MRRASQIVGLIVLPLAVIAVLISAPLADAQGGIRRYVPVIMKAAANVPMPLPSPAPSPLPVPPADEATQRITVPSGFAIRIYASGLDRPRLMTIGPDGQLYVADSGAGSVARLPDANRDGKADAVVTVARGLSGPNSVEWFGGSLYVAEQDKITRLTDANRDGDFLDGGEKTLVTSNIPCCGGHSSRTIHFGPDGKLYVAAGSSSNNVPESDKRRATIMRFNPDGSIPADNPFVNDPDIQRHAVWAEGLRNSVDFLWTPSGQLWASSHGSDGLGDNVPPEEIVINVERGKHYGWPFCYTPTEGRTPAGTKEVRDPRVPFAPPIASCDQVVPAVFTDKAHSAPIGMELGRGPNFPADYRDDLFVAYHGSWNTNDQANYRDCKVQRIELENGQPVRSSTFANIKRAADQKCGDAWGRPADVVFGTDGVMYISDDRNGNIYRVVYTGP